MSERQEEIRFSLPFLNFEGPLDLLLHLVRKNQLDIHDISISELTRQYLEYLELLRVLNVELASEFLVMASTLIYIKSRSLLPRHEGLDDEPDPEEMRRELSRKLIEYEKYKEAAAQLLERPMLDRDVFKRKDITEMDSSTSESLPITEVGLVDLLTAFKRVLDRVGGELTQDISIDRLSISDAMTFLLDRLGHSSVLTFSEVMEEVTTKSEAVAFFLAILELAKLGALTLFQAGPFEDITLVSKALEG
ncbi:MAG: segregation/condensation protein A [Deltaproteobacteria bacterium]|nr:segregation/condensation protein A [Deltaproteobacteria bacterium]